MMPQLLLSCKSCNAAKTAMLLLVQRTRLAQSIDKNVAVVQTVHFSETAVLLLYMFQCTRTAQFAHKHVSVVQSGHCSRDSSCICCEASE